MCKLVPRLKPSHYEQRHEDTRTEESGHSEGCGAGGGAGRNAVGEAGAFIEARGVKLLSVGLDEAPMAYKDIEAVMRAQSDLVDPLARFHPRLVKMAKAGERPED